MTKKKQPPTDQEGQLLDFDQVCQLLQVSGSTVDRLRKSGKLPPSFKIGRNRRWRRKDLVRWINDQLK